MIVIIVSLDSFTLGSPVPTQRRCSINVCWIKKGGTTVSSLPGRICLGVEDSFSLVDSRFKIKIILGAGVGLCTLQNPFALPTSLILLATP